MSIAKNHHIESRVNYEVLDSAFRQTKKHELSSLLVPLLVCVVMWPVIDHTVLLVWSGLMTIGILSRYHFAASYVKSHVAPNEIDRWARKLYAYSLYFGILWAASAFVLYTEDSPEHQLFIIILIIMRTFGSMLYGLYGFPMFYLQSFPMIGALVLRFVMEGTPGFIALSFLLLMALLSIYSLTKRLHKTILSEKYLHQQSEHLNQELANKTEEAERSAQAKSKFLAAASHDLRQPLHALTLFLDALKASRTDSERTSLFKSIDGSLNALRKLFDSLLDISRLDADVVKPSLSHINIKQLMEQLVTEFSSSARHKKLQFRLRTINAAVVSDPLLLERVLRNLLSNAIRYTHSGGILFSCRRRDDIILLQLWDTGPGIAKESQGEVFREFHQLHNHHRDRAEGLGLGLALVQRICQLLAHPLQLQSKLGHGSVFSIELPIGSLRHVAETTPSTQNWQLSGFKLLVIDDEKDILHAMQALLTKWGGEVITVTSLTEALETLDRQEAPPDIVISDLRLPGKLTGIDAIDQIRQRYNESISGLIITGDTDPDRLKLVRQSQYPVLQKPVMPAKLRSMIHHHLTQAK